MARLRMNHSKTSRVAWSVAISSTLLVGGCGKKSSNTDSSGSEESGSPEGSKISQNSGNLLTVSGQLALGGLELTGAEKGILAFTSRAGDSSGEPKQVSVDADGKFKLELARAEDAVVVLVEEAQKARDVRDYERMARAASALGVGDGDISAEKIRQFTEEEIQEGVGDLARKMKEAGPVTLLVAYDKTGDRVSEASSFRFISLPTPSGRALSSLPNERMKGDMDMGKISGTKRDVTSELASSDAFDLSAGALESLADVGRSLKNIVNSYMNKDWKAQPFYFWKTDDTIADVLDQFSDVGRSTYQGYGFYIGSHSDLGLSYADVCGGKPIVLTPPSPVDVVDQQGAITQTTVFDNGGQMNTSGSSCSGGNGFYGREDNYGNGRTFMLNFGTGGSIVSSPRGLWRLTIDGQESGRFDFDLASPVVDGKPVSLVPRAKFITSAGQITGVEVELYRYNGSAYEKVTDLGGFRRLVNEFAAGGERNSGSNEESRTMLEIGADNRITGVFDSSLTDGQGNVMNPPIPVSDVRSLAVYYVVANASYRIEFRP